MEIVFRSAPSLREIQWCPFDPQAADWTGDYNDALAVVYDRYWVVLCLVEVTFLSHGG